MSCTVWRFVGRIVTGGLTLLLGFMGNKLALDRMHQERRGRIHVHHNQEHKDEDKEEEQEQECYELLQHRSLVRMN